MSGKNRIITNSRAEPPGVPMSSMKFEADEKRKAMEATFPEDFQKYWAEVEDRVKADLDKLFMQPGHKQPDKALGAFMTFRASKPIAAQAWRDCKDIYGIPDKPPEEAKEVDGEVSLVFKGVKFVKAPDFQDKEVKDGNVVVGEIRQNGKCFDWVVKGPQGLDFKLLRDRTAYVSTAEFERLKSLEVENLT